MPTTTVNFGKRGTSDLSSRHLAHAVSLGNLVPALLCRQQHLLLILIETKPVQMTRGNTVPNKCNLNSLVIIMLVTDGGRQTSK
jgi:hypothetical protein